MRAEDYDCRDGPSFRRTQTRVPRPSRVLRERAGLFAGFAASVPPDTRQSAQGDALFCGIQSRPRLLPP